MNASELRAPFASDARLTLCRITFQAGVDSRMQHVSIGYLTQPASGRPATYRERWLPEFDHDLAMAGFVEHAVLRLARSHDVDFIDGVVTLRAVIIDFEGSHGTINFAYDVAAGGQMHPRLSGLGMPSDSFHARNLSRFVGVLMELLAS